MSAPLQAAEQSDKAGKREVQRIEIPAAQARALAKQEIDRAETKTGKRGMAFDAAKFQQVTEVMQQKQNDPQLVELRGKLGNAMAKPPTSDEQRQLVIQLQEELWAKEKELLLAAKPELREYVEQREALNREMKASLAAQKAPPEVIRAVAKEMSERQRATEKKQGTEKGKKE
jgi:hypothetical protein